MPICARSGYALLTDDNEVLKFEEGGNRLAGQLIEKHSRNQNWRITVEGIIEGDQVTVLHLKLLKPN